MQTGEPFAIFQDRNDIAWGQHWEERINKSLSDVAFLIPVITPSFFNSPACRTEFDTFNLKERMLGVNRLILPLYYVPCDQLGDGYKKGTDKIVDNLRARNWTDWRAFRFKSFSDENVAAALASMASVIKASMNELKSISVLAASKPSSAPPKPTIPGFPKILSEEDISSAAETDPSPKEKSVDSLSEGIFELRPNEAPQNIRAPKSRPDYYAYTKRFDEVIEASALADRSELLTLHKYLMTFSRALKKLHGQSLSHLLGRFSPKKETPELAVSVLIDNSGSMRGTKITHTAAWCLLISEWMDRLRIPHEVLGYTTRAWKGGQSRELWLSSGKPKSPGRLNDLRHLVYKSFSASVGDSAPNFGVMAREGLLKENIDGEAILWAMARLGRQPSPNKLLFVISDGAPVDDSTLSVNPGNFLEKHLRAVIDEAGQQIKLYAIGVEYDVARYYPNAVALNEASELGPRFFELLVNDSAFLECFLSSNPKKRYRFSIPPDDE